MPENTIPQVNQSAQVQSVPLPTQPQVVESVQPQKNSTKKVVGIVALVTTCLCCCACVIGMFTVASTPSFKVNFKEGFEEGLKEKGLTLEEYCSQKDVPFRSSVCDK